MPDWRDKAACLTVSPALFFPEKEWSEAHEAKKICGGCESRVHCLRWALENDEDQGIWGGLAEKERRRLKARLKA